MATVTAVVNKLSRILIVCALIFPIPVYAEETEQTTVTEGFDNQQINEDITFVYGGNDSSVAAEADCNNSQAPGSINIEDMDCHGSQYYGADRYQIGLRSSTDALTIAFPNSETKPITEVGLRYGARESTGTATVYYDDDTTSTINFINTWDAADPQTVENSTATIVVTAPSGTTINEIVIPGASDNLQDWWLIDDVYYKYTAPAPTTTTTTVPPPPPPPPTTTTTLPPVITVIMDDGTEAEYEEYEVEDGTVERDNQRLANLEEYGCEMTDAQIERGDCDIEIYEEDEYEYEEEKEELSIDITDVLEVADDDEVEEPEVIELTEEEILALEEEMESDAKELELLEEEIEFIEELSEEELEEFVEVILEVEEYIEELEEFQEEVIIIEEDIDLIDVLIANDIFPPDPEDVIEDLKEVQDELIEDTTDIEEEIFEDEVEIYKDEEQVEETVLEILNIFDTKDDEEEVLSEEVIEEEVAELEEVIDIPVVEEELTEEEVEEVIEEYVEELETEEVVEVLEEVNDIGVQNLSQATEETQEVVQAVVEEAIEEIEELTEEQVEVVAEVLQVEAEDVEIIAEAVKEDESVATAVEEYVERAVENKDVENYTLADVVTEVQFEEFIENPIESLTDINIQEISISNIGSDMTNDQKEKAQEVVVPVILTRIASMAAFIMRKS
ncbi:MAG: hypothetical protein CL508_05295 [Actinobacteria bacterium]|nr:hypothetical protein [Actinomycetota bacterium]MBO71713.1 hypothetical protein [Actinomycetota bacterium]